MLIFRLTLYPLKEKALAIRLRAAEQLGVIRAVKRTKKNDLY